MIDTLDDAVELTTGYLNELLAIANEVGVIVRLSFEDLARTDRADIAGWVDEAKPYVQAGSTTGADLAAAYISEMTGTTIVPADLTISPVSWDDPFLRTWHQLAEGYDYAAAKASGASVAQMLGQDATIDGAAARSSKPGVAVRGWRRVITAKACEWCRVVGTQLYRSQESATFGHHGCQCTPVPVFEGPDASAAINQARLAELKASGALERVSAARERSRARS